MEKALVGVTYGCSKEYLRFILKQMQHLQSCKNSKFITSFLHLMFIACVNAKRLLNGLRLLSRGGALA